MRLRLLPYSIEIATRAADHFTRLYYSTYDSATRFDDLPNFYRPNSALTWNGKPFEGVRGHRTGTFVERLGLLQPLRRGFLRCAGSL